jgi:hypothetical protein
LLSNRDGGGSKFHCSLIRSGFGGNASFYFFMPYLRSQKGLLLGSGTWHGPKEQKYEDSKASKKLGTLLPPHYAIFGRTKGVFIEVVSR